MEAFQLGDIGNAMTIHCIQQFKKLVAIDI